MIKKNNLDAEIVVVNDGSIDNTRNICEELTKKSRFIKLVNHEINMGYSQALSTGIKQASNEYIIPIDSDEQFDVNDVTIFLEEHYQTGSNVIFGYRVKRKGVFLRKLISFGMTKITNILFGSKFKDTQCVFQFIKADILKSIDIVSPSFQVPTEIKIKLASLGHNYTQIPVTHLDRKQGEAKLKALKIIPPTITFLIRLKLKTLK
tara:strand:- start:416 stop:1033 length:618 start_codon:yes stop_codon:yes gene_type:complete